MDIPLPGEPEPVFLIPTPDSPKNIKITSHHLNDLLIPLPQSPSTESFFSDIPMPDEKPANHNPSSRYSPTGPFLDDDPPPGRSPTANHNNRFLVLGKAQAKKRLLAFSATKQAGGAGLTFNLPKKTVVKPNLAKGFEQLTEDGDLTPDAPVVKKKATGKKGAPKEDKAKAVVSAIEEIKREELLMRGAFRMAALSSSFPETVSSSSLQRQLDRKKDGDMHTSSDDLLGKDKEKEKERKSRSRKHRSSSDKKSERHTRDRGKDKDKGKDKEDLNKERAKNKSEICKLPDSWAEFHSQKMDFDQIKRAKRELLKKKSSRSSRSKDTPIPQEQLGKELCNPFDFPSRLKEPLKAVGARQREKLYSQDTLHYTKSSPVISYSENPDIPSSRYRNRSEIFTFAKDTAISIMDSIIKSEEKIYVPSLIDTDTVNLKSRLWYDSSEVFMKPKDSDSFETCKQGPITVPELQPSSISEISEMKQPNQDMKEMDSDPTIPDTAPSKWDSEFEEDPEDASVAESKSLTTNVVPNSSVPVHANHEPSPVEDMLGEEATKTNGLPNAGADTPEQPSQSAAMGVGSDPYLVNEYEEFMKSVCVNTEETGVGTSCDNNLHTGSENIVDDSKKKRQRVDSEERSKSVLKKEISSKKSTTARKDKRKRRSKESKKVRKDSTSSSPVSSEDEEEEVKPRVKRRKIKTKKSKLRSWKKSKKRKRQVSTSSSDEISSSSISSDSSVSDSSLENSSTSEERVRKKRVKKVSKKKKVIMKKSKQKKEKRSKKKETEQEKMSEAEEFMPVKTHKSSTDSKDSTVEEIIGDKCLGKVINTDCCWEDVKNTDQNQLMETVLSRDPVAHEKSIRELKNVLKFPEKFTYSPKAGHIQCESVPLVIVEKRCSIIPLLRCPGLLDGGNVNSSSGVMAPIRTSPEILKEIPPNKATQSLFKGNEKYEIDSAEDGDSSEAAFSNGVIQVRENHHDCAKDAEPNFSRLAVISAEAWENDSQEKLDDSKKLKYGGEWEDTSVNWFIKSLPEEQVKPSEDLLPVARTDGQNTSSLSDDLHQEVGKRSLRELKYLRDVIKNEVVDEGATLESPPVKPVVAADSTFLNTVSLVKTAMVTSFVKDFSERTDFRPVPPPTLENVPSASELYSPGQEDDKSSRSSSPELREGLSEETKSDMSLDSPDLPNKFNRYPEKHCELMARQFLSLGNIPLPPKCDLEAIEMPGEPATCQSRTCVVQAIEVPEEPSACFPSSLESPLATTIGKPRAKETIESSSLAKTKHVITVKLLPSELRFKSIASEPSEVSAAVEEIMPRNDGKTVWKAIGGPNETAVPIKSPLKKASRWNSVPCEATVGENVIPLKISSLLVENEAIDGEVSKDASEMEAAIGLCADELSVTLSSNAAVNEVSSSIIGADINARVSATNVQVVGNSSADTSLLKNLVPPECEVSKHYKAKEHSELSDREKELPKKLETRDRDNSRSRGSRSRDDSKRRDNREKDTKRKEDRSKEDARKGDRSDSRSRDRHRTDPRRDRRDVKRSRDDRHRSSERNDSRHSDKHRPHGRDDEARSPGSRKSKERSDRRRRSRSRENSRSHRRSSRKRSPNHDRLRSSENKDDGRSSSHKSMKDSDKRRSERSGYNASGDSLVNIPLPDIQHHGRDDCGSMDMECCSPVSNFSPLVGLKRSVADSTTISDEELKLANCEQKSSMEDYSKECYSYESPLPSNEMRNAAMGNMPSAGETEFSPKRLSLDERLELELGLRMSPRQQQEQTGPPDAAQYQCYWQNQPTPPDGLIRAPVHLPTAGPHSSQFVGNPTNYYSQPQQHRLHNFTGAVNSPLVPTNLENSYPPNVRWDHLSTFPGISTLPDRSLAQPLQQVIVPEKQFIATVPMDNYVNGPPLPVDLVNRPLPGPRPLSPRILPASIPKVVLIPPIMAPMAVHAQVVQSLVSPRDFIVQPNSIAEGEMHMVHKFYPEDSIYADIPSDTEADQKIIEMLSKAKKKSLGRKAANTQKELIRKREILQARELKRKKLAKYKKAILHEGDTLRRSVPLDLEEMRLNTGMQLSPQPQTSSSDIAAFSPVGNFAPLPPASKGILISIGFGVGNDVPSVERRKSVMFADGIRPGEGTSPSAGEDPLSPTSYIPKEKKLRKKKKKIKVHVIRQLTTEESSSDSESPPPPPPPPGSPPPELKPYSFPGPSPGKMILRLSKRIAMGGCRVPRVILENPSESKPTTATAPPVVPSEAFESTCSDEKTLKLIAYHQAMIAIKGQVPFWSQSVPCQTVGTESESKPQLPHSTDIVMKAITTGPVDSFDQGNGNGAPGPSYPPSPGLASKSSSSAPNVPTSPFSDSLGNCAAHSQSIFGEPKVAATGEGASTASSILTHGFGFPSQHGLQPQISNSPQLHNPPPPPPPLPVTKTSATAVNLNVNSVQ